MDFFAVSYEIAEGVSPMFRLLIALMTLAAMAQFGMTVSDLRKCRSRACIQRIERRSRDVLSIDWKPISMFPDEASRAR
jgi:hypothetical protein